MAYCSYISVFIIYTAFHNDLTMSKFYFSLTVILFQLRSGIWAPRHRPEGQQIFRVAYSQRDHLNVSLKAALIAESCHVGCLLDLIKGWEGEKLESTQKKSLQLLIICTKVILDQNLATQVIERSAMVLAVIGSIRSVSLWSTSNTGGDKNLLKRVQ